jgi:hypothetical protein
MAGETQEATDGYYGEFHLQKGSALYEFVEVKNFGIPGPGAREQQETTHLKSPGRRRQYISTFFEDSDFDVVMNTRVLSDTDLLCDDARNLGDERPFKAVIPENGAPVAQITGTAKCIGYDRGEVTDGVMEATATFRVVTIDDIEAYSAGA